MITTMSQYEKQLKRLDRQTETASLIVEAVAAEVERGMPADSSLARIYRQHPEFGSRDRRIYTHAVYAYFRWLGWTRLMVSDDIRTMCAWAVLIDPSSSDEMCEMWKPVINLTDDQWLALKAAPVRDKGKLLSALTNQPTNPYAPPELSLAQLMPVWVESLWQNSLQLQTFIESCQCRPPTWLRIPAADIHSFCQMLATQGVEFFTHEKIHGACAVTSPFQLVQLERAYGKPIQVQDIASQAVGLICQAEPGSSWWDVCSGAGGKTLHLAESVGATGKVLATDTRESILQNLSRRAAAHQYSQIETAVLDVSDHGPEGILFDGVLVDAPCSGIGTWPRNPDARWRTMADTIAQKAVLQLAILTQASQTVKPGGVLVYSVCSITEQEGSGVVRNFLKSQPDFKLEEFSNPINGCGTPGELTITPNDGPCDGMYLARMRRKT